MQFTKQVQQLQGDVARNIESKATDARKVANSSVKLPNTSTILIHVFIAFVSVVLATQAVNYGFIYENIKPSLKVSRANEQEVTRISGTKLKLSCVDMVAKQGNLRVNWFLDNKQIASQVKTEGERFSSNFVGRHGSIQKKIDISHLGRLAVEKVRKSDQGIYSCESVGQSLLGYEKVEQKRWFRLKVVHLETKRYNGTVAVIACAIFALISVFVSLVETVVDDLSRIFEQIGVLSDRSENESEDCQRPTTVDNDNSQQLQEVSLNKVNKVETAKLKKKNSKISRKASQIKRTASRKSLPRTKSKVVKQKSNKKLTRTRSRKRM